VAVPQKMGAAPALLTSQSPGITCGLTLARTEGPFYSAGSPERTNLVETGMVGARVSVVGFVYDTNCQPIPNAWLDFWQANYYGQYDNIGYTLRGHQYADQSGYYHLETIVPGEYTGRTVHIHVKVQAPGGQILTTQLFFPDVADNSIDNIYDPSLVVALEHTQNGKIATYNFVVNTSSQSPKPPASNSYTFKETGFTVSGRFWDAWQGGRSFQDSLYINGYPITALRDELSPLDGKVYRTQWFERARLEFHPENQAPNDVLLGLLGLPAIEGRQGEAPFKPVGDPENRSQWFSQTGHTVGDDSQGGRAIAAFWSQRGDVRQFGLPLSQPFMEANNYDGKTYLVQYFERQRFEYHPEYKGTRYEVLLRRLGAEQVRK
jgi:protocatechuate 3,4-dioxygenase beta subunit